MFQSCSHYSRLPVRDCPSTGAPPFRSRCSHRTSCPSRSAMPNGTYRSVRRRRRRNPNQRPTWRWPTRWTFTRTRASANGRPTSRSLTSVKTRPAAAVAAARTKKTGSKRRERRTSRSSSSRNNCRLVWRRSRSGVGHDGARLQAFRDANLMQLPMTELFG